MEALVRQLLQRAEDELYDYDPASDDKDDEKGGGAAAAGASAAGGKEEEVEKEDEEARFWAHMRAQQAQAVAQAQAQARAFRREWSVANGLCHLRVVGRRIELPSTPAAGAAAEGLAAEAQAHQGRRRHQRRAAGPGWEWHAPARHRHRMGDDEEEGLLSAASSDAEGEPPSGTARGYFGAPLPAVVGTRVWKRQQLDGEEEEEVFARFVVWWYGLASYLFIDPSGRSINCS